MREQKAAEKTDAVLTRETTIVMTPKPVALVSGVLCALAAWAGAWRPCAGRLTSAQRRSPQKQPIHFRCPVQFPQIPLPASTGLECADTSTSSDEVHAVGLHNRRFCAPLSCPRALHLTSAPCVGSWFVGVEKNGFMSPCARSVDFLTQLTCKT